MATAKQIAVNQANALESTGPRTVEGKARSRMNALKHGLAAAAVVVPWEAAEDFDAFRSELFDSLKPQGQLLRRAVEIEGAAFIEEERDRRQDDAMSPESRDERCMIGFCADHLAVGGRLLNLTRYEAVIERGMFQALHELQRLQAARSGAAPALPTAIDVTVISAEPAQG